MERNKDQGSESLVCIARHFCLPQDEVVSPKGLHFAILLNLSEQTVFQGKNNYSPS